MHTEAERSHSVGKQPQNHALFHGLMMSWHWNATCSIFSCSLVLSSSADCASKLSLRSASCKVEKRKPSAARVRCAFKAIAEVAAERLFLARMQACAGNTMLQACHYAIAITQYFALIKHAIMSQRYGIYRHPCTMCFEYLTVPWLLKLASWAGPRGLAMLNNISGLTACIQL